MCPMTCVPAVSAAPCAMRHVVGIIAAAPLRKALNPWYHDPITLPACVGGGAKRRALVGLCRLLLLWHWLPVTPARVPGGLQYASAQRRVATVWRCLATDGEAQQWAGGVAVGGLVGCKDGSLGGGCWVSSNPRHGHQATTW